MVLEGRRPFLHPFLEWEIAWDLRGCRRDYYILVWSLLHPARKDGTGAFEMRIAKAMILPQLETTFVVSLEKQLHGRNIHEHRTLDEAREIFDH